MRGRATVRDLSVFAGWFGLPNDEFLLPWRSISAEQPGGLDTKATGLERTMVIVAGHITVEPQQRKSYRAGCVRIVEQARRAVRCLDVAICADPGRVNIFERWESRRWGPSAAAALTREQRPAMLTVSVHEYDIDVRPVFGKKAE
jgi:quinol monooxygenase YgiN